MQNKATILLKDRPLEQQALMRFSANVTHMVHK